MHNDNTRNCLFDTSRPRLGSLERSDTNKLDKFCDKEKISTSIAAANFFYHSKRRTNGVCSCTKGNCQTMSCSCYRVRRACVKRRESAARDVRSRCTFTRLVFARHRQAGMFCNSRCHRGRGSNPNCKNHDPEDSEEAGPAGAGAAAAGGNAAHTGAPAAAAAPAAASGPTGAAAGKKKAGAAAAAAAARSKEAAAPPGLAPLMARDTAPPIPAVAEEDEGAVADVFRGDADDAAPWQPDAADAGQAYKDVVEDLLETVGPVDANNAAVRAARRAQSEAQRRARAQQVAEQKRAFDVSKKQMAVDADGDDDDDDAEDSDEERLLTEVTRPPTVNKRKCSSWYPASPPAIAPVPSGLVTVNGACAENFVLQTLISCESRA